MKTAFIVVAAGRGERFGEKKQWKILKNKPLVAYSLEVFEAHPQIDAVFLGAPEEDLDLAQRILKTYAPKKGFSVFAGGEKRAETVRKGLELAKGFEVVGIHDAARPFVSFSLVTKLLKKLEENPDISGAAPFIPVWDTVKLKAKQRFVSLPREKIIRVQTPQVFRSKHLLKAFSSAQDFNFTDESTLMESCGMKMEWVKGEEINFKITTKEDWEMAERLTITPRVGFGYDIHRVKKGKGIKLGGIFIPCDLELIGHSDADPVLHALTDAILGATASGDIGEWFPDTDPRFEKTESSLFVREVLKTLKGLKILNVDITIIAEKPKLGEYKRKIKKNIAELLGIPEESISIKAKTKEGLDATGEGKAIECLACVLLA